MCWGACQALHSVLSSWVSRRFFGGWCVSLSVVLSLVCSYPKPACHVTLILLSDATLLPRAARCCSRWWSLCTLPGGSSPFLITSSRCAQAPVLAPGLYVELCHLPDALPEELTKLSCAQPVYEALFGYHVFGLGFVTSMAFIIGTGAPLSIHRGFIARPLIVSHYIQQGSFPGAGPSEALHAMLELRLSAYYR